MNEPRVQTRVAWAGWDEHHHFGHRVYGELLGRETYASLMAIAVSGRRPSADERAVLEDLAGVLSIAEPRIWPNKAARLAASYGRPLPGLMAGCLCFESDMIGPWTTGPTARNLVALRGEVGDDPTDAALDACIRRLQREQGRLVGFGVAFRPQDERVIALTGCIERRGRSTLPYWALSTRLWAWMRAAKNLEPNIGSASAAALLDLGFDADQIPILTSALNLNIFVANAFEASQQKADVLRRLPDSHVRYVGAAARRSPRSTGDDPA